MNAWPKMSAHIERIFTAAHSLQAVQGGSPQPHRHEYRARFGWTHEVAPNGLSGGKSLGEWNDCADRVLAVVENADLNEVCAPYPATIEVLAMRLLSLLPAYFESVELSAYSPRYTVRVDRRGLRLEWPRKAMRP